MSITNPTWRYAFDLRRDDLADTEAADDTPVPAPTGAHWGPRPAEVPVITFDSNVPADWPLDRAVINAYQAGRRDGLGDRAAFGFRRLLWGALAGFTIAMVMVVGGCAVIAALDSGDARRVPTAPSSWSSVA